MYAYLLAGENLELAQAELEGVLESQDITKEMERMDRLCFTEQEPEYIERLALLHEFSEVLEREKELETGYRPKGSFAVRAKRLGGEKDTKEVERELGELLSTDENSVDLQEPDEVIRVYIFEDEYVICRLEKEIDRGLFEKRKNQNRPFSSPISLDPVLARVLVNLSAVPVGGTLLDPFCGTGGILIEAGLCGVDIYGTDLQQEMVEGTRENLEEYGIIRHQIKQAEIAEIDGLFDKKFDAVVTDLPYGKASKHEGEPVKQFLEKAPEIADKIVFMSDQESLDGLEPDFEVYVHKNLTRYIYTIE